MLMSSYIVGELVVKLVLTYSGLEASAKRLYLEFSLSRECHFDVNQLANGCFFSSLCLLSFRF